MEQSTVYPEWEVMMPYNDWADIIVDRNTELKAEVKRLKAVNKKLRAENKKLKAQRKPTGMSMADIRAKYFPNMTDEDWEARYEPTETIAGTHERPLCCGQLAKG